MCVNVTDKERVSTFIIQILMFSSSDQCRKKFFGAENNLIFFVENHDLETEKKIF